MSHKILKIGDKKDEKSLRHAARDFDFSKFTKKEVSELVARMKKEMRVVSGVGLSANQIGLDLKLFVAEVRDQQSGEKKFYAIFNPKIEKAGGEKVAFEEGCLSIPLTYGEVERSERITLSGYDKNGKRLKIKAWGLLAMVFQHEVDHLNGTLFIDKANNIRKYENVRNYEKG